jgi:hypothetical protein
MQSSTVASRRDQLLCPGCCAPDTKESKNCFLPAWMLGETSCPFYAWPICLHVQDDSGICTWSLGSTQTCRGWAPPHARPKLGQAIPGLKLSDCCCRADSSLLTSRGQQRPLALTLGALKVFFFPLAILRFEFRVSHLLGRCSTT